MATLEPKMITHTVNDNEYESRPESKLSLILVGKNIKRSSMEAEFKKV